MHVIIHIEMHASRIRSRRSMKGRGRRSRRKMMVVVPQARRRKEGEEEQEGRIGIHSYEYM